MVAFWNINLLKPFGISESKETTQFATWTMFLVFSKIRGHSVIRVSVMQQKCWTIVYCNQIQGHQIHKWLLSTVMERIQATWSVFYYLLFAIY